MAPGERESLALALQAIRRRRGLRRREVAKAMGMGLRTYENFESGRGPATYERLVAFCAVVGCDLPALLLCHHLGGPQIAVQSADNKALSIVLDVLEEISASRREGLAELSAATLVSAFELARAAALTAPADDPGASPLLAPRQVECLRWVQAGKSSFAIGAILGISPRTVDDYIRAACTRLGVRSRVQAVSLAIKLGLISP